MANRPAVAKISCSMTTTVGAVEGVDSIARLAPANLRRYNANERALFTITFISVMARQVKRKSAKNTKFPGYLEQCFAHRQIKT